MTPKIRVLMVDDEPQFRETTARVLNRKGFDITIAASGEEALEVIAQKPQDVVILDVKMGGMDGHQALTELKKIAPETQVIMLTGHGSQDSAIIARQREAFDYLNKPCDINILTSRIHEAYSVKQSDTPRTEKKVRDIMTRIEDYSTISVNQTVREAVHQLMRSLTEMVASSRIREAGHRALLVFNDNNSFVGLLSNLDLIRNARPYYLSASQPGLAQTVRFSHVFSSAWDGLFTIQMQNLADKKVGELTLERPPAIDENANLMEVAEMLYQTQKPRLIVTSGNKLIGILRVQDLFFETVNIITRGQTGGI